jgi:hypothetical protein
MDGEGICGTLGDTLSFLVHKDIFVKMPLQSTFSKADKKTPS